MTWEDDQPGECGGGDVGYGTTAEGEFEIPCQVGVWTIRIPWFGQNGIADAVTLGEGRAIVRAGEVVRLDIVGRQLPP